MHYKYKSRTQNIMRYLNMGSFLSIVSSTPADDVVEMAPLSKASSGKHDYAVCQYPLNPNGHGHFNLFKRRTPPSSTPSQTRKWDSGSNPMYGATKKFATAEIRDEVGIASHINFNRLLNKFHSALIQLRRLCIFLWIVWQYSTFGTRTARLQNLWPNWIKRESSFAMPKKW
jgi:hypothetical protein